MRDSALTQAIEIVGGNAALGKLLGISREAVGQWDRCPPERVLAVSAATGGKVKPHELRPDICPAPESQREFSTPEADAPDQTFPIQPLKYSGDSSHSKVFSSGADTAGTTTKAEAAE